MTSSQLSLDERVLIIDIVGLNVQFGLVNGLCDVHLYPYTYTYKYTRRACMFVFVHVCMRVRACADAFVWVSVCVCARACGYVCVYSLLGGGHVELISFICMYVCIYIYIYIDR